MRFNDREMVKFSESKGELEGVLNHMKPQGNDWSEWYQQSLFKERMFKLIANLLFYYRVNEQEPLGVLVLENAQVSYEKPHRGTPFAFSITFKSNNKIRDSDGKHVFSCRCEADVNKWVTALKSASYEYWRSQYVILKTKISMRTGKDPVLDYMRSKHANKLEKKVSRCKETKQSTFYSHVEAICDQETGSFTEVKTAVTNNTNNIAVDKLIEL